MSENGTLRLVAGVWLAGLVTLSACGPTATDSASETSIHGLRAPFELKAYAQLSDTVILGTPVAEQVLAFRQNDQIPEAAKDDEFYAEGRYVDVTVEVQEYFKGDGPGTLSVRRRARSPGVEFGDAPPVPEVGQPQVMFLSNGTGLWAGGNLVLSLASVEGGSVELESGRVVTLDEFRSAVEKSA